MTAPDWGSAASAVRIKRNLGLCTELTVAGKACESRPLDDLPVCANHIAHWVVRDPRALVELFTKRATRVVCAHPYGHAGYGKGRIAGLAEDKPVREVVVCVGTHRGRHVKPCKRSGRMSAHHIPWATWVRLDDAQAQVASDLLADLGNTAACECILLALNAP